MTNTAVGISGFGGYVPERVMTERGLDPVRRHFRRVDRGTHRHPPAPASQPTTSPPPTWRRPPPDRPLESRGIGPEEIDEIIVATDTPEVYTPDTASFVQRKLGAREVPSYDLGGSGCAGFVQAMDVARSRVQTGTRRVLVIGVELITRLVSWKIRETCVLFGDAAAGVIVERGPQMAEILGARTGTDGSQWSILTLEIGGTRKPFSLEYAQKEEHLKLIMEGRAVFRHAVHRMSQVGLDVLEAVGAKLEDVAMIVPHQANLRIVQGGREEPVRADGEGLHEPPGVRQHRLGICSPGTLGSAHQGPHLAGRPGAADLLRRRLPLGRGPAPVYRLKPL